MVAPAAPRLAPLRGMEPPLRLDGLTRSPSLDLSALRRPANLRLGQRPRIEHGMRGLHGHPRLTAACGVGVSLAAGAALAALAVPATSSSRRSHRGLTTRRGKRLKMMEIEAAEPPPMRKMSGLARDGNSRGSGNVVIYNRRDGFGEISFGSLGRNTLPVRVVFSQEDLPAAFLEKHNGEVPEGLLANFDVVEAKDGVLWARNIEFPSVRTFMDLGLHRDVAMGAATALGRDTRVDPDVVELIPPAPVQTEAIPKILKGEDLVIAAETGSGKSLAYMLPLVQSVLDRQKDRSMDYGISFNRSEPMGLVICPTRELAMQAFRTLKLISHKARFVVKCCYGGEGTWSAQKRDMVRVIDILVATPDRLQKFHSRGMVSFKDLSHVVLDEADFLLTQGFADLYSLLDSVSAESRHAKDLRYTLITASITKPLWKIFQEDRRWRTLRVLESKALHRPQANCSHTFLLTRGKDKVELLESLLRPEITSADQAKQTLVFCNTVSSCKSLAHQFGRIFARNRDDKRIGVMHKELGTEERNDVLKKFALGDYRVVICTDIAQRGLDLPNCGHVVNFDFPLNSIDYLHRAGRTARFGEPGKVTSLVRKGDKYLAKAIERSCQLGKPINNLSGDKRDYLRGGSLHHLLEHHPRGNRALPASRPTYDGSLR